MGGVIRETIGHLFNAVYGSLVPQNEVEVGGNFGVHGFFTVSGVVREVAREVVCGVEPHGLGVGV